MLKRLVIPLIVVAGLILQPSSASAHCDALDGPVVQAAKTALEKNDVTLVLRWVPPAQEAVIRDAFTRTVAVRALDGDARALADTWFFETLVRIHRAGEGASFDGLKPSGQIEPFIAAVDRSLTTGAIDTVVADVTAHVGDGIRERFARARAAASHADVSVDAGREYVAAYVDYLHYVEALHLAGGHGAAEGATTGGHEHPDR